MIYGKYFSSLVFDVVVSMLPSLLKMVNQVNQDRTCHTGVCALVHTTTLSNIPTSFTFLYVHVHKIHLFLVRVTNSHIVLPMCVSLPP